METSKPVTTRRIIKPGGVVEQPGLRPAASAPVPAVAPAPAGPALDPLWRSWQQRFQEADRALITADARERNGWEHAPRQANPAEVQRIQQRFLDPWHGLIETFAVAVISSPLSAGQRQALQGYLDLRAAWYRALMKRFLVPSDLSLRQVAEVGARLDAALAARRPA